MALRATYEILRDGRHVSSNLYKSFDEILAFIGCDRASAKDFHEIRAVFTQRVA